MLTNRQRDVLNFIEASINENGYPPTYREICEGLGISQSSVKAAYDHVAALISKGFLVSPDGKARAIRCTNKREEA